MCRIPVEHVRENQDTVVLRHPNGTLKMRGKCITKNANSRQIVCLILRSPSGFSLSFTFHAGETVEIL